MGNTTEAQYHHLEQEIFEDVDIDHRNYDCVLVFDLGSAEKDWKAPTDGTQIQYDYLKLLDAPDIEKRKELFPQHGADFSSARSKEKDFYKNERKLVIKALTKLSVKCKHISAMGREFESDKNLKFYYIGISERRARQFADKIGYQLELDPQAAISYLQLMDEPLAKATVSDEDDCKGVLEKHWKNVFIKYDKDVAPEMYKPYDVLDQGDEKDGYEDSLFRIRDRLALINEIVCQDVELGGCGIYVPLLAQKDHCIVDFYPLHTLEHLDAILNKLFSWSSLTYNILSLPLDEIQTYFGEYIAIYFAYLEFMTKYFVPITIVGTIIQFMQWADDDTILIDGIEYFALFVVVWSIAFPILWRRRQFRLALKWGTLRFAHTERPRPEFLGEYVKSNVNGEMMEYFPSYRRYQRRLITFSAVAAFLIALFGSIMGVIALRVWVTDSDVEYGSYYISVANALVIMVFNNIYGILAEKLNIWENYETETEYENNLIVKIFIFRFINSYATLYYIVFFRRFETDEKLSCSAELCMHDLRGQLATIFITQLTVSNAIELGSLFVGRIVGGGSISYFTENEKDLIWNQYSSETYERTFDDYCEILVSFGYATLFVVSFPLATLAAFAGCIVEARIDGYKLCKLTRRPFPRQADDIGTWQLAMEVMGWAVLVTNLAIICFSAEDLDFTFLGLSSDEYFEETLTALIICVLLFVIVAILNYCIATKPKYILDHIERQQHLERSTKQIGQSIERYLDSIKYEEIVNWKNQWNGQRVAKFLQEIVYKNPEEYRPLERQIRHSKFDGKQFNDADEHILEKRLEITDHLHKRFILNARRVLEEQIVKVEAQNALFEALGGGQGGTLYGVSGLGSGDEQRDDFTFTNDNLIQMAEFFEEDLTGQSKRKLWAKVDKDMSSLIEANEMENFLYFSIVVYIKAKYQNVRLPKKSDKKFQNKILKPLERWLLHYKMSAQGLTFDEFDRFFPSWLREYYREQKQTEMGQISKYSTIRMEHDMIDRDQSMMAVSPRQSTRETHLAAKMQQNKQKKNKLAGLLGSSSGNIFGAKGPGPATMRADVEAGLPLTTLGSGADSRAIESNIRRSIARESWNDESIAWEKRLSDVARAIDKTDKSTREKIWNKFDRKKVEKLDCDKSLSKLVYSLIALYLKTKDRNAKPPSYSSLQPLLVSISTDIKLMINASASSSSQNQQDFITKQEFENNISVYLKKIAHQRKQTLSSTHSLSMKRRK